MANKVSFGLSNVHYALISERTVGNDLKIFYGTPKRLQGAVNLEMETVGDVSNFYADNIIYYASTANQGYEATLEIAMLTEEFRREVLGEVVRNGLLVENSDANPRKIALMFQFEGDERAVKHCLTYCTVTRPGLSSSTKTETTEPTKQELTITVSPRPTDNVPRISTSETIAKDLYDNFFKSVPEITVIKGTAPKGVVTGAQNNGTGFTVSYGEVHEALYFNGVALKDTDVITDKLYHKGGGTGFKAVYATKEASQTPTATKASSTITITFTDGAKASTGNYVIIDGLTDKDGNPINEVYEYENAKWNKRD